MEQPNIIRMGKRIRLHVISQTTSIPSLSATALNIAILYDKLSKDKQNMLLKIAQIMREEGNSHD